MKKKGNFRKVVSGLLAGMTMLSTVLSPMTAYAAEIQPEEKPPLYEEVKDLLDEDEVVTAKDYEIETGSVFDVKSDYTGLEIKDDNKVKVTFEEAKNEKNEDFTTDHADTYKAVYYVEPVNQEHPKYQISRKLIVREKETEVQTEAAGSEAVTESETAGSEQQTEEAEDSEAESEITDIDADEFDDLVEQAQNQDTYDEESGLELHDVLEQAGDEGVDLDAMEEGEIATFEAVSAYSARSTQQVTIEKGPLYRYADYNLGTYLTEPYYISYGSVRAIAYCVQPAKPGPGSGNYTITKIGDNQALAKVCYYGTDAAGSESFFANKHTDFSEGKRFIIIHMAASYANGSSDAFYGTNATGEALAKELYNYCVNKPEIPDVAMSFSKPNVKAYVDGNVQRTENIQFNASSQQKITMDLPKGVKLHNVSTGNVSAAGASVTIGGGTTFYLSAPLTQTKDVSSSGGNTEKGNLPVIVLTAKDSLDEKVKVLTSGADDYITKPFEIREVLARIKVQLRHTEEKEIKESNLSFREMVLNKATFQVSIGGKILPKITRQEFAILELLLRNPKQVFSKEDIFEYAWDEPYMGETKTLDVHISNIRKKIKTVTSEEYIETVWGIGYRLHL